MEGMGQDGVRVQGSRVYTLSAVSRGYKEVILAVSGCQGEIGISSMAGGRTGKHNYGEKKESVKKSFTSACKFLVWH